jgi:pimeloyl-ACP methyl ester carboxylesterase
MSVPLFHRDLGGAGLPPLVVLHGILGSSRNWQTAGRDLAARFHVLALDLRNHGRSPHDPEMSFEAMAGDVAAWLDAQGLGSVSLMGHSMGGKVAMLLACRHPARVGRLVVVDIAPRAYRGDAHEGEFAAMNALDLAALSTRVEAERLMSGRVPDFAVRKFLATNLERTPEGAWRWQIGLAALTAARTSLLANPLRPDDRYEGPAAFVAGGRSDYVRAGDWPAIRRHFPAAEEVLIPEAGHNPHMEARDVFVARVGALY